MNIASTTIKGYSVDIEKAAFGRVQCTVRKGSYTAELKAFSKTGKLVNPANKKEHAVAGATLGDIENWAYNNGY